MPISHHVMAQSENKIGSEPPKNPHIGRGGLRATLSHVVPGRNVASLLGWFHPTRQIRDSRFSRAALCRKATQSESETHGGGAWVGGGSGARRVAAYRPPTRLGDGALEPPPRARTGSWWVRQRSNACVMHPSWPGCTKSSRSTTAKTAGQGPRTRRITNPWSRKSLTGQQIAPRSGVLAALAGRKHEPNGVHDHQDRRSHGKARRKTNPWSRKSMTGQQVAPRSCVPAALLGRKHGPNEVHDRRATWFQGTHRFRNEAVGVASPWWCGR